MLPIWKIYFEQVYWELIKDINETLRSCLVGLCGLSPKNAWHPHRYGGATRFIDPIRLQSPISLREVSPGTTLIGQTRRALQLPAVGERVRVMAKRGTRSMKRSCEFPLPLYTALLCPSLPCCLGARGGILLLREE